LRIFVGVNRKMAGEGGQGHIGRPTRPPGFWPFAGKSDIRAAETSAECRIESGFCRLPIAFN
jgi:hypothetical protein